MHARWLALSLSALVGCAGTTASAPRLLPNNLHLGTLDQRTSFELDDGGSSRASTREASGDRVDTPKKQRRRKILYFTGLGALGIGALGFVSFGIGGRIVQAQLENGYDDGTLTRDRQQQLDTTGTVMNGLAIGSAVVGLAGVILAATVYGIDHSRCGDLPPRRKQCGSPDQSGETLPASSPSPAGSTAPGGAPESGAPGPSPAGEPGPAPDRTGPEPAPGPAPTPSRPAPAGGSPGGSPGGTAGGSPGGTSGGTPPGSATVE